MKRLIALVVCLSALGICAAKDFDPFQGPKPLAVFIQSNPWAMVVGSDTPRVAIYDNGDVIFQDPSNDRVNYLQATLDKNELESIREIFRPLFSLNGIEHQYNLRPNVTDQPTTKIYAHIDGREVVTSVYGMMCSGTSLPAFTEFPGNSSVVAPPGELIKLHKRLCAFNSTNSKSWVPRYIEVMLWDYSYAPEPSIHWPKEWPALTSTQSFKHGDMYSVFLDGTLLSNLRDFLSTQNQKGAIEVSGEKMAASYRFVFPSEPIWRKAFRQAAQE